MQVYSMWIGVIPPSGNPSIIESSNISRSTSVWCRCWQWWFYIKWRITILMKVDWFLFQWNHWIPEMPLSVVDALLTEPLMLLKAEEVKANWNWNVKRKMLCSCETPGCSWSRGHGEGLWITATLLPAGQQLSRLLSRVKATICYYHLKSEHFYHISFKLLPNALNYWNFCSTRKPGQGWLLSSLQRSRQSNFYQQSES